MKDPIEDALEKMKPAELPPELMARLTAARPQAKARESAGVAAFLRRWLLPLSAGACAAVATLVFLDGEDAPPTPPAVVEAMPFQRSDYLLGARNVGTIVAPDHRAYRIVEVEWMEEETIHSKQGGPGIRVETKRREVIPVALEVF